MEEHLGGHYKFDLVQKRGRIYYRCKKCKFDNEEWPGYCEECDKRSLPPVYKWDMVNKHDANAEASGHTGVCKEVEGEDGA